MCIVHILLLNKFHKHYNHLIQHRLNHLDDARVPECPISICAQFNEEFIIVGEDTFKVSLLDPKTGNVISCIKPKLKNLLKEVFPYLGC